MRCPKCQRIIPAGKRHTFSILAGRCVELDVVTVESATFTNDKGRFSYTPIVHEILRDVMAASIQP